jgi:hypothetical protein
MNKVCGNFNTFCPPASRLSPRAGKGVIVNAKAFHAQLQKTIHEYSDLLKRPESIKERAAFRKKMNYICQVENKPPEEVTG